MRSKWVTPLDDRVGVVRPNVFSQVAVSLLQVPDTCSREIVVGNSRDGDATFGNHRLINFGAKKLDGRVLRPAAPVVARRNVFGLQFRDVAC